MVGANRDGFMLMVAAPDSQYLYYVIPSVAEESEMPALDSIFRIFRFLGYARNDIVDWLRLANILSGNPLPADKPGSSGNAV